MVGRTLRPKTDGSKAVILDHAGLIHSHGMPDAPRKWTLDDKKHREKPPPTKTCELCYRVFQTDAGWRLGAACEREFEPGCLLNVAEPEKAPGLTLPEVVNGALQQFTRTPDWAGGIDLLLASGPEYRAMMERADTWAKVDEIRKMRGYSPYWTKHVLRARREKAA
jgi:DNA repair protein RadD